jgi:hypothetical protein
MRTSCYAAQKTEANMSELLLPISAATALYAVYHYAGLPAFILIGLGASFLLKLWGDRA